MEVIIYADIEQLVIDYLTTALARYDLNVPVGTRIPNPRPDSCVVVTRNGGSPPTIISDDALVTFDSRGTSEHSAASLAAMVRGLMHAAEGTVVDTVMIYRVQEAAGPSNNPDPTTPDQSRYSQLMSIHYRGVVLAELEEIDGK